MYDTVEAYLTDLKAALSGADPALTQDAIYDAEEYLRTAVADANGAPGALAAAVDAYGPPAEVASAYREAELTLSPAGRKPASAGAAGAGAGAAGAAGAIGGAGDGAGAARRGSGIARFFGIAADPAAWGALFYLVLALATGVAYFTIVVTGLSLTAGLAVLIVGVPFALLFLAVVRAISLAEGRLVEGLLGVRMPRRPRTLGVEGSIWQRIKSWLADVRTWTTMLYMVLQLPLGIIYFTVIVTAASVSAGLIALPVVQLFMHTPVYLYAESGQAYYLPGWLWALLPVVGVLGLFATLWMAKGIGTLHASYAKAMLVGRVDPAENPAPAAPAPAIPVTPATGGR